MGLINIITHVDPKLHGKLATIEAKLTALLGKAEDIMSALDDVLAKVATLTTLVGNVAGDVQRLKDIIANQQLPDGSLSPEGVQQVVAALDGVISSLTTLDESTPE